MIIPYFMIFFQCFTELEPSVPFVPFVKSSIMGKIWEVEGEGLTINSVKSCYKQKAKFWVPEPSLLASLLLDKIHQIVHMN